VSVEMNMRSSLVGIPKVRSAGNQAASPWGLHAKTTEQKPVKEGRGRRTSVGDLGSRVKNFMRRGGDDGEEEDADAQVVNPYDPTQFVPADKVDMPIVPEKEKTSRAKRFSILYAQEAGADLQAQSFRNAQKMPGVMENILSNQGRQSGPFTFAGQPQPRR
jgi:hypothetical protein